MNRRMGKRKLTRLILAALMSAGGGLWGLSSVEAADVTTDTEINTNQSSTNFRLMGSNITFTVKGTGKTGNLLVDATDSTYIGNTFVLESGGEITGYNNFGGSKNNTWNIYGSVTSTAGAGMIAGGMGNGDGEFSGNKVNVFEGAQISTAVYGAYSPNYATITNNTVTITGGTFSNPERMIAGGHSTHGIVTNNTVAISGDTTDIAGDVFGGSSNVNGTVGGASADDGNKVTVSGGTINGSVYGGYSHQWDSQGTGNVTYNTVNISGTSTNIGGNVYGGQSDTGEASNNTVTISGGTIGGSVYGGYSRSGKADNNTVTISGGTINGNVFGASIENYGTGSASNNTLTITGGTFDPSVMLYGGSGAATTNNNTVNILKAINVLHIMGGDGATSEGNTLNIAAKGVTVGAEGIGGFKNLNFFLPTDIANGDTMLTVNAKSALSGEGVATDLTGVTIGAAALTGVNLVKGNTVTLITNPNGLTTDATTDMSNEVSASLGEASFLTPNNLATDTKYTLGISKEGENAIIATVTDVKEEPGGGGTEGGGSTDSVTNDRLKSPVETKAATVTLLNAGADLLASQGFAQAANAVALEAAAQASGEQGAATPTSNSFTPFAAFGGSSMRAESGSHVDTKGFGINVGFAKEFANSQGKLLFGPVVEYGGGKYDSYNNDIHADGNSHYWGIGLMARQVNHDGFYYEGSVRGGRVTSDYSAQMGAAHVSYDSTSNYWAAHLGVGKAMNVGGSNTLDAYLKYFYSHQGGDDTTIHIAGGTDERASFDSVDSNRIRVGARYTHKINEMNSLYGGLAYQYEFGGEARAHYSLSGEAPSPSVKGSSGMLELGWQVKPNNGPVTIDLGVTGWAGKQRGGSVQLGATWTF